MNLDLAVERAGLIEWCGLLADAALGPPFLRVLEAEEEEEELDKKPEPARRKRRPPLATIIRQAIRAGLTIVAIRPDGTLITDKSGLAESDAIDPDDANDPRWN